jgi:hypothetical protein
MTLKEMQEQLKAISLSYKDDSHTGVRVLDLSCRKIEASYVSGIYYEICMFILTSTSP